MDKFGRYESDILSFYTLPYEIMDLKEITFDKNM